MTRRNQTALVLEGGGNRGVFTAGVLDYLMEQGVDFSYVTGVSAGACNAVDFVSGQPDRTRKCTIPEKKEYRYISARNVIHNRTLFDMDMIFDRYPNEIYPFDFDTYFRSETRCELVVTNCLTGLAEYKEETEDPHRLMDICRASSSIPVASPMVMLDGKPYLDGGIADSIPLVHAMREGYRKNVVILTRNYGYRKKKPGKSKALYLAAFKEYPNLLNALLNRYRNYNRTLELIEKWEKEGHIYVIRPEIKPVARAEQDKDALNAFYQHGYDLMKEKLDDMTAYLKNED
jgi:predicted patatin/cPLA2 family phospholipase